MNTSLTVRISDTAKSHGWGRNGTYRWVSHLTKEEKAIIQSGGLVVIHTNCLSGGNHGTLWRIVTHSRYGYARRVPTKEEIAIIENM